jgi:hypothetical protein
VKNRRPAKKGPLTAGTRGTWYRHHHRIGWPIGAGLKAACPSIPVPSDSIGCIGASGKFTSWSISARSRKRCCITIVHGGIGQPVDGRRRWLIASGSVPRQRSGQGLLSSQRKLRFVTVNENSNADNYDNCDDANAERSRPTNLARPLSEIVRLESIDECPNHSPGGIKDNKLGPAHAIRSRKKCGQ